MMAMIVIATACTGRRHTSGYAMAHVDSLANHYYATVYSSPDEASRGLTVLRDSVAADSDTYYAMTPHIALARLVGGDAEASDSMMTATRRFVARNPQATAARERLAYITAVIYSLYGRNRESADDFLLAAQYARENRNWQLAVKNLANAGELLEMAGNPAAGVVQLRAAILLADSTGMHDLDFSVITRAAGIYNVLGNIEESDRFYQLNEPMVDSVSPADRFHFYSSRGNSYYYRANYGAALAEFIKAGAELASIGDPYFDAVTHSNMGECYMYIDSLDSARYYIDLAVKEFDDMAVNDMNQEFYVNSLRGELELRSGNLALARRLLLAMNPDSVSLAPRYVALHHHRLRKYYSAEGNYPEALRHLALAETLDDSILHFISRNYSEEVNARYRQDTTILNTRLRVAEKDEEISRLYLWVAILVVVAVIITLSVGVHSQMRRRRNKRRYENLRGSLLKMRLENARNRISPHFIFNILNAELPADNVNIRNLVSLMRLNLELCNRQLITLGEELDFIRTYIDVVAPSLGDDFSFTEYVDPSINPEQVKIPAMVLQIVVENAVKHGLSGYDYKDKKLSLDLRHTGDGYLLTVCNTIPGQGIANASGTGTGLRIISQTIGAFNQRNCRHITMTDETLPESGGVSMFRVRIFVPEEYHFDIEPDVT